MSIKNSNLLSICNNPIKDEITYLGIKIVKNEEERCKFVKKDRCKKNYWDLSLRWRVLITKAEGISRHNAALSLAVNDNTWKIIDKMLYFYLWKNKTHYIKKYVVMNSTENGGLNFLDFRKIKPIIFYHP